MTFEGALVKEQGVTLGIVVVAPHVLHDASARGRARAFGEGVWRSVPIVLMAQDAHGTPTYWGRPDLVRFLANLHMTQIPWKRWSIAA